MEGAKHRPHDEDTVDKGVVDEDGRECPKATTDGTTKTMIVFKVLAAVPEDPIKDPRDRCKRPNSGRPSHDALVKLSPLDGRHRHRVCEESLGESPRARHEKGLVVEDPIDQSLERQLRIVLLVLWDGDFFTFDARHSLSLSLSLCGACGACGSGSEGRKGGAARSKAGGRCCGGAWCDAAAVWQCGEVLLVVFVRFAALKMRKSKSRPSHPKKTRDNIPVPLAR